MESLLNYNKGGFVRMPDTVYLVPFQIDEIDVTTLRFDHSYKGFMLKYGSLNITCPVYLSREDFIEECKKDPITLIKNHFLCPEAVKPIIDQAVVSGYIYFNHKEWEVSTFNDTVICKLA